MKKLLNGAWKEALLPIERPFGNSSGDVMAVGSLAAGIGLFVLSMLMVLAVGFVAGALVLIEKIAHNVLGEDAEPQLEVVPVVPRYGMRRIERV